MDWGWINLPHISDDYEKGVEEFIQFAQLNVGTKNKVRMSVLLWIVWIGEDWMLPKLENTFCAMDFWRIIQHERGVTSRPDIMDLNIKIEKYN